MPLKTRLCFFPLYHTACAFNLHCSATTRLQARCRSCGRNQDPGQKGQLFAEQWHLQRLSTLTLCTYTDREPTGKIWRASLTNFRANCVPVLTDKQRREEVRNREVPPPSNFLTGCSLRRIHPYTPPEMEAHSTGPAPGTQGGLTIICPSYKQLAGCKQIKAEFKYNVLFSQISLDV